MIGRARSWFKKVGQRIAVSKDRREKEAPPNIHNSDFEVTLDTQRPNPCVEGKEKESHSTDNEVKLQTKTKKNKSTTREQKGSRKR